MPNTPAALSKTDLLALVNIGRELAAEVNLHRLVHRILGEATTLTDSEGSSLLFFDERRSCLYFADATGPSASVVLEEFGKGGPKSVPLVGSKAGEVFTTGKPIVSGSIRKDARHFKAVDRDTGGTTRSMVCVPLNLVGQRLGVVQLVNKRRGSYTARDLALLEHLAAQAAVAVRNARLFEDLLAHMGFYGGSNDQRGPIEVMKEITGPPRAENLSVMFADMRGFTQLCHYIGNPERTQRLLNSFLHLLAEAVIAHHGIVNKFLGDGLLALFRQKDHATSAVQCAVQMVEGFHRLKLDWNAAESYTRLNFLDLGVGITTNEVILGSVGSERVRDFTAIGTAVNLAAFLMELARDGRRIVIDKLTFHSVHAVLDKCEGPFPFEFKKSAQTFSIASDYYVVPVLGGEGTDTASGSTPAKAATDAAAPDAAAPVFISYSHKDKVWLKRLQTHLKPYERLGKIAAWDDEKLRTGTEWKPQITAAIDNAQVAVLLVSPSFLASDFIASKELPPLLTKAKTHGLRVFWLPVSECAYDTTEIPNYQGPLDPSRPLDVMKPSERNKALSYFCKELEKAVPR
jgi:class 3 adenylate cyclase